jgi:hypothetical protein
VSDCAHDAGSDWPGLYLAPVGVRRARPGRAYPEEVGEVFFKICSIRFAALWRAAALVGALLVLVTAVGQGPMAEIVRRAASIPETAEGLEGFVNAANALISPALVAMAAVAPLGCLVGAGALMFGSRRGMVIIGASLGTLIFLGSVKGIVA